MATNNSINSNIPIEIAKGGSNTTTIANTNGVTYFDGTRIQSTAVGTATHVLTSNGSGVAPTFQIPSTSFTNIELPTTTALNVGTYRINSLQALHAFGTNNIFVGLSGNFTLTGVRNSASGHQVMVGLGTGSDNSALGYNALNLLGAGLRNTACGVNAGTKITSGNDNIAIGFQAVDNLQTGSSNIGIGTSAGGTYNSSESNNICIGNVGVNGDSTTIRIGSVGTHTRTFISSIRGVTTVNNDAITVLVDSAGQLGTVSSSKRFKENISDIGKSSDGLMKLRPVQFNYKSDDKKTIQYGLIAEEVLGVYPGLVVYDDNGDVLTIKYHMLDGLLLSEIQKNRKLIEKIAELSGISSDILKEAL